MEKKIESMQIVGVWMELFRNRWRKDTRKEIGARMNTGTASPCACILVELGVYKGAFT